MDSDQNGRSGRRTLVRVALTVALFGVVVFAVDQLVPGARHRLARASPGWLGVAAGLELLACAGYVLLFQTVFSRAPWLVRLRRGAQIALGELGAFAITPTGLGGPAVRVWGLRAGAMPWRVLIVRSISHGAIFNLPYAAAAVVLGAGVSLELLPGHAPVLTALAPLALVVAACALYGVAAWFGRRGSSSGDSPRRGWVLSALGTIPEGIADFLVLIRKRRPLLGAIGWWAGDCAALWAAFQAVGGRPARWVGRAAGRGDARQLLARVEQSLGVERAFHRLVCREGRRIPLTLECAALYPADPVLARNRAFELRRQ